jgi:hypothetical protein
MGTFFGFTTGRRCCWARATFVPWTAMTPAARVMTSDRTHDRGDMAQLLKIR